MRQPVHVVYGGAQLFKADTTRKLGRLAERLLAEYAPDAETLAEVLDLPGDLAPTVYARVIEKLKHEPVEDYRIDYEDGYGIRADEEEDSAVDAAVAQLQQAMDEESLPPFIGFRVKSLAPETRARALRTLERFLSRARRLPEEFVVTLPKIAARREVEELMEVLGSYPDIGVELMIETPYSLMNLNELVDITQGRCVGAHFGPYDYTSLIGITSHNQSLLHPACDFARSTMLMKLSGTGIAVSDGPTPIMPLAVHRGETLTAAQTAENRDNVHKAWKLHYKHVRAALYNGIYQGWDLHPGQFPIRYAAVYAFFLEGLNAASERLRNLMAKAVQSTRVGNVFDDAATGQGLLNYVLRAMSCGAIPESEIPALSGLTLEQLRTGSFTTIMTTL
jgi:citrate lyase beta subunit